MKKRSAFLIPALLLVSCTSEPPAVEPVLPTREEAKAAITEKITMAAEKWASGDVMGYYQTAAPDITWMDDLAAPIPVSGKENLKAYLENFAGQVPPHKFELLNMAFQFYEDIVVVTYHYQGIFDHVKGDPWKVTAVYRYMDEDWFSVHENWTVVESGEEAAD